MQGERKRPGRDSEEGRREQEWRLDGGDGRKAPPAAPAPHTLLISSQGAPWKPKRRRDKYCRAAFVVLLRKGRKMANDRGLISPSDFAQLQKYMECESSSRPEVLQKPAHSPLLLTPSPDFPVAFSQSAPEGGRAGEEARGTWGLGAVAAAAHLLGTSTACPRSQTRHLSRGTTLQHLKRRSRGFLFAFLGFFLEFLSSAHSNLPSCRVSEPTLAEGRESQTRLTLLRPLHTLDSTRKVSDVLKLFEEGEMSEYLQGDVSGLWATSP